MRVVLRLLVISFVLVVFSNVYAGDFCIDTANNESAYKIDLEKSSTKEDKAYFKKLAKDEKKLLEELIEQVYEVLEKDKQYKNIVDVVKQGCWVINHDQKYANALLAYSAETDPLFRPRDQLVFSKAHPTNTIRLNVTEKLIKLLAFAKEQRGDNDQIQSAVLGFAGSFIVRDAHIALSYMFTPMRDLRNSLYSGKDVTSSEVQKIVNDQETKVKIERAAIQRQQGFVDLYKDDGLVDWIRSAFEKHPEFFEEKLLIFKDGIFSEVDPSIYAGQYRVGEIVRELSVNVAVFRNLDGIPPENIQTAKKRVAELLKEWDLYINSKPSSDLLQNFVMEGVLTPFIQRYQAELSKLPVVLK